MKWIRREEERGLREGGKGGRGQGQGGMDWGCVGGGGGGGGGGGLRKGRRGQG